MSHAPDPGLFGPDSVTWKVHADPSMALAGVRALMLQTLHPLAMAGVAQHSDYRHDPWGRLARTGDYLAAVNFGTTAEAARAAARLRALHARLSGVEPETGLAYRVSDPELLLWVHCTEVDSFLDTFRRCGGRLTGEQADRYVAEQARTAELVGIDPADAPHRVDDLQAYYRRVRPRLRLTAAARETLWFLFNIPVPLPVRPAWTAVASLAFTLQPRWARRLWGPPGRLVGHRGADVAATATSRSLRVLARVAPPLRQESPALLAARERLDAGSPARLGA
ncbi:oxygenase MpaB family protein [soil metagenome]